MQVTFCGAARQVTGSCFLFDTGGVRFLVDCGLFQGTRQTQEYNHAPFPFDPRQIQFVVLTHAHLDHSGLLPRLAAQGFNGPIYTTAATRDLISVLLPDAAYLQQTAAERAARYGKDFVGSYTMQDVREVLKQVRPAVYGQPFEPAEGIRVQLRDAGHIIGSAIVELWFSEHGHTRKVVVTGDLGQPGRPILRDPTFITDADALLIESTYGNRDHKPLAATLEELVTTLRDALNERESVVLVPAFAVGRTQEFLYFLNQLCRNGQLEPLNVFVDSPMATEVTAITARHWELFDEEARRLTQEPRTAGNAIRLKFTGSAQESMALNRIASGAVIVAGSGMCDGGRIRHHLRQRLPNTHTTVLIIGFQTVGTLGRKLVDGAPLVRIMGEDIPVRAQIVTLGGFSAHADQAALLNWLRHLKKTPRQLFIVHGEEEIATGFATQIEKTLGWKAQIPRHGETIQLM